jgi:small subunit ribosomal protein S24e
MRDRGRGVSELKLDILESRVNKLIGRRELIVRVAHWPRGTPSRKELREQVAKMLGVDPETVYVRKVKTDYGACESLARVHVYDSAERALQVEPPYIIKRHKEGEGEKGG